MTYSQPESNYSISNLTVAELEALITKIVQKVIREEIGNKKWKKRQYNRALMPNHLDHDQKPRPFGLWRGKVQMSDDFDVLHLEVMIAVLMQQPFEVSSLVTLVSVDVWGGFAKVIFEEVTG